MGFLDDIWTALLSDDHEEVGEALERISEHEVAAAVARATLAVQTDIDDALLDSPSTPSLEGSGDSGQRPGDSAAAAQP